MRATRILLFFMSIISSFCIANAVFAENAKEKVGATDEGGFAIRVDWTAKMTRYSALAQHLDIRDDAAGISRTHTVGGTRYSLLGHRPEMFKVLSVLEMRLGDEKLLKKIEGKLPALSDDRLRTMASLSERIAADDHGAKADIAFLILTSLIIFS